MVTVLQKHRWMLGWIVLSVLLPLHPGAGEEALKTDETGETEETGEPLPSILELSRKYVEANGGLRQIRSAQTAKIFGQSEPAEGEPIPFQVFRKRPDMMRITVMYENYEVQTVVNGERVKKMVVSKNGKETILELSEAERRQLMVDARMNGPFFQLMDERGVLTVEGFDEVDGQPAIRLRVSEEANVPFRRIWLSRDHFQEIKLEYRQAEQEAWPKRGDEVRFDDFKKVDGLWLARRVRYFSDGEFLRQTVFEKIRTNVGIFDSYFRVDEG